MNNYNGNYGNGNDSENYYIPYPNNNDNAYFKYLMNKYNMPGLGSYLNKEELNRLQKLEEISNKTLVYKKQESNNNNNIMNWSLKKITTTWANVNIDIFNELVGFIKNLENELQNINHIKNLDVKKNIMKFLDIFIKNNRVIFFGITLILISIFIYIVRMD